MSNVSVTLVEDIDGLERLRGQWLSLWETVEGATIFQSHTWVYTWVETYRAFIGRLFIVLCWRNTALIGIAPLYIRYSRCGYLTLRQLMYCGTGEPEAVEVLAEYMGVLARPDDIAACERALASLVATAQRDLDGVVLRQILATSHAVFAQETADRFGVVQRRPRGRRFEIPVTDNCVPASFSASRRKTALTRQRRLHRQGDVTVVDANRENFDEVFDALVALHNARWQAKGEAGVFARRLFRAFHRRLINRLLDENRVMLFALRVGEQIIAVHYCLISKNAVHFYQSGIDEEFRPNVSPGLLCHVIAHRRCHERGYAMYDLMVDEEHSYKAQLADTGEHVTDLYTFRSRYRRYKSRLLDRLVK